MYQPGPKPKLPIPQSILQRMAPAAAIVADLGEDLLREIFLLLPTPADLHRAALTCKPFLRAVRSAAFLRLFRRRHPFTCPRLLGCFIYRPIEDRLCGKPGPLLLAAFPAAAATRGIVEGGDFKLSFLYARGSSSYGNPWNVLDCRNGRLLLRKRVTGEMAVADPLTRRCVSLPAPPAKRPVGYGLVTDDGDSSAFQVFCILKEGGESSGLRALVLSSGELRWADVAGLALAHHPDLADRRAMQANRSLYWGLKGWERMVELNTGTMKFSVLELPPFTRQFRFDVIEKGGDGAGGLYLLTMRDFCVEVWGGWEDGSGGLTWTLVEKSVRFQRAMEAMFGSEHFHGRGLHVIRVVAGVLILRNGYRLLSIDLETMRLRMLSRKNKCPWGLIYPYTIAWPPSFLNPTEKVIDKIAGI